MRIPRHILGIILALVVAVGGFCLLVLSVLERLRPDYRFTHKDQRYYSEFARACDLVLEQHPLGTNEVIRIPDGEQSLPKIVRDLQPRYVTVSSNRVHLIGGDGRGFGISWEQDEAQTNVWVIKTSGEGLSKTAYAETR